MKTVLLQYLMRFGIVASFLLQLSCKKSEAFAKPTASITVVNAIATFEDTGSLQINSTGSGVNFSTSPSVDYYSFDGSFANGSKIYGIPVNWSTSFKVVKRTDTLNTIFEKQITANPGDMYGLYFAGTPDAIDTLFIKDIIPLSSENTTGVRFINLCSDRRKVSINLESENIGSAINSLDYKEFTGFKTYGATSSNYYVFEVHDAETNELLTSFGYEMAIGKNVTLIVRGRLEDGPSFEVVRLNHY